MKHLYLFVFLIALVLVACDDQVIGLDDQASTSESSTGTEATATTDKDVKEDSSFTTIYFDGVIGIDPGPPPVHDASVGDTNTPSPIDIGQVEPAGETPDWCAPASTDPSVVSVSYRWVGDTTRTVKYFTGEVVDETPFVWPDDLYLEDENWTRYPEEFYFALSCGVWPWNFDLWHAFGLENFVFDYQDEFTRTVEIPRSVLDETHYCSVNPFVRCNYEEKGGPPCWSTIDPFWELGDLDDVLNEGQAFYVHGHMEYCVNGVYYHASYDDEYLFGQEKSGYSGAYYLHALYN